jgi:outer membrane protein assembly factor BamB
MRTSRSTTLLDDTPDSASGQADRPGAEPDGPGAEDDKLSAVPKPLPEPRRPSGADHDAEAARAKWRARYRRRRLGVGLLVATIVMGILVASGTFARSPTTTGERGKLGHGGIPPTRSTRGVVAEAPPAAESGTLPWELANPISRESVVAGAVPGTLLLSGGLTSTGSSSTGVFALTSASGAIQPLGSLPVATHDVAGASLGGTSYLFGGGTSGPSTTVQAVAGSSARVVGQLPNARADAQAVTVGRTIYLVGGYAGGAMDPEVLSTTNGQTFSKVAALPVPVRYPAVASIGSTIYVFGGETLAGQPVDAVQAVDVTHHRASLVGTLPVPLGGAVAADLAGTVYLAGGATTGGGRSGAIYAFEPVSGHVLAAGVLRTPVAYAGAATSDGHFWIVGGETAGGALSAAVQMVVPNTGFGRAGEAGAGSPYFGDKLLIADRGNNRLLLVSDAGTILWQYPSAQKPPPPGGFYFPDDAFFIDHGTAIISNQEENETIVEIAYPSGQVLWQYGHPHQAGYAAGYLDNPDDAYLLKNGDISVADPVNCRVLVINPVTKTVLHQIGTPGSCVHRPPTYLGSPNGDTPLPDGNLLVSEINGSWIDEYTTSGQLVWDVHLPSVSYPSDPQPLGPDRYLVADYATPGAFVEFDRTGNILYRYSPTSGPGELNLPSLVEQLPSGVLMANDDSNDRMVAIDPATGALVWQYGIDGQPGTAPGSLSIPDGFDILAPGGVTPTHTATG